MLVMSRKKNESVVINNDVTITVVEIRGDKVRLGIVSPKDVPVHRQEVWEAIHGCSSWFTPPKLHPDEVAFLRAIRETPDDDTPRLVYSDWLEERGDPRGEFIWVQCELARLPASDGRRRSLKDREQALLNEHGAAWRAALPPFLRGVAFVRGFVESSLATVWVGNTCLS